MKHVSIIVSFLLVFASLHAEGITLLYKSDMGWNDPLSWLQINTPVGQTPIQRVPTEEDDVVFSFSMSGISSVRFKTDDVYPDFNIGGSNDNGPTRCKSMHVSNTTISFDNDWIIDGAPNVNVYTSNGGFVIIDSGSNMLHGRLELHGGNPAITDLQILHSTYGVLFSHADWTSIEWDGNARLRLVGSTLGGFRFVGYSAGNIFIDSCTIETNSFMLGDNSTATLLNSTVTNNGTNVYLKFLIGRNSNFISANVKVLSYSILEFTTSGSELNGDIGTLEGGGGGFDIVQEDPANLLPNIINGNITAPGIETLTVEGDLKISGNLSGFAYDIINIPIPILVNGQQVFTAAGFGGRGHYKLEFYGSTNSNISWNGGFPIDTLIINKTGCAKVTFDSSLYVAGATRIQKGQLALNPNAGYPYKFVCAGDLDIAVGGGLLLRKDAAGITANMAIGGTLTDHNPVADSTCEGLSNPYNGTITFYTPLLPVTLLEFNGKYQRQTVTLNWSTERETNTKYFTIEKSFDQSPFIPLVNVTASGNTQSRKNYQYTDDNPLKAINYYRLKMVDADGRFTYSKVIAIAVPMGNVITVFPNPVKDKLSIRLTGISEQTEIIIADTKGTVVKKFELKAGITDASVNTVGLPAGVYSISFQSGKSKTTQQLIKE